MTDPTAKRADQLPVAPPLAGTADEILVVAKGSNSYQLPPLRVLEPMMQTLATTPLPHFGIGLAAVAESQGVFLTTTARDGTGIGSAIQFQRNFDTDTVAWTGNKNNVRFLNTIGDGVHPVTVGICWAISAETVINAGATVNGDATSISAVTTKLSNTANGFAGHFQVRCPIIYSDPTTITPVVGIEVNLPVVGPDNPTANNGFGNRVQLSLFARTDQSQSAQPGFAQGGTGTALMIQHTQTTNATDGPGYYDYGIVIKDNVNYAAAGVVALVHDAIRIDTWGETGIRMAGGNTIANIFLDEGSATYGYSKYGLICGSANYQSGTAIRIHSGMKLAMDETNSIALMFNRSTNHLEFYNGATLVGHLDMGGTDHAL